jgi:glycosyltransferase involved in cell wall biosynthesis
MGVTEAMRDPIRISVITAAYNAATYLPDLLESVIAQDYPHYEHVIIDDGSKDDTAALLTRYAAKYPKIHWWKRENKGQYATQNEALAAACGDFVVVIAADDILASPDVFGKVVSFLQEKPDTELVYGKTGRMDARGLPLPDLEITSRPSRWLIKQIVYAQHCSVFASRKTILENHLSFDRTYRYAGDWDWLVRLFHTANHIGYIKEPLSVIRMHEGQISRRSKTHEISAEHRRVSATYGGNYKIHVLFTWANNWRAMALLAIYTIRREGWRAFSRRLNSWGRKRLGR